MASCTAGSNSLGGAVEERSWHLLLRGPIWDCQTARPADLIHCCAPDGNGMLHSCLRACWELLQTYPLLKTHHTGFATHIAVSCYVERVASPIICQHATCSQHCGCLRSHCQINTRYQSSASGAHCVKFSSFASLP
jgi:hypothetical protein